MSRFIEKVMVCNGRGLARLMNELIFHAGGGVIRNGLTCGLYRRKMRRYRFIVPACFPIVGCFRLLLGSLGRVAIFLIMHRLGRGRLVVRFRLMIRRDRSGCLRNGRRLVIDSGNVFLRLPVILLDSMRLGVRRLSVRRLGRGFLVRGRCGQRRLWIGLRLRNWRSKHLLRSKRLLMFGFDFIDGCLKLVHLPAEHFFRRTRLHVLELPLNGAASLFINFRARLRRVRRQSVDSAADHRYKISHQHFLMIAGCLPAEWIISS
jgi:hypothetical protein